LCVVPSACASRLFVKGPPHHKTPGTSLVDGA
jgi:hypothetical protein